MKLIHALLALALGPGSAMAAAPASVQDPQHRALAALTGAWSVKQTFWSAPGTAPRFDSGTATFSLVLKDHHLKQVLHIADGTGFEGLGYIGYDEALGRLFATWMDVNFTGIVFAQGTFDAGAGAYIFRGNMSTSGGGQIPVREVMTISDPNHFSYQYFEMHDGHDSLTVKLEYTRAGVGF